MVKQTNTPFSVCPIPHFRAPYPSMRCNTPSVDSMRCGVSKSNSGEVVVIMSELINVITVYSREDIYNLYQIYNLDRKDLA